ncbi:unnamed protein product [Phaedon cochleariae]|uniref:Chromo domain-containing protein n=1 Tax=Phaedon cochleariae TaxID=80249 RepID=A0A9P0GN99_PHACE|nr:unnamed protein product [Phaedon cochleariae]
MDEKNDDSLPSGENVDEDTLETILPVEEEGNLEQDQNMDIDAIESAGTDANADVHESTDGIDAEGETGETLIPDPEESNEKSMDADLDITPPNLDAITETLTEETGDHSSSTDTAVTDSLISAPAPTVDASISSDALVPALTDNVEEKVTDVNEHEHISDTKDSTELKSSSAVYSLEEELQRMHEGDPIEEPEELRNQPNIDLPNEDKKSDSEEKLIRPVEKVTKPIIRIAEQVKVAERSVRPAEKTYRGARSLEKKISMPVLKVPDSPIMKNSDLEEILGADEVVKDPILIKEAQEEMKVTDVLVCGKCYESFIFIEEFQKHKLRICKGKSGIWSACENETKPQVWGFTLWKSRQMKSAKPNVMKHSDWKLYQSWCSLAEIDKNAWIAAGQSLQYCNKIGTGKLTEVRQILQTPKAQVKEEKDPLALDGYECNKENTTITVGRKPIIDLKKPLIRSVRVVKDNATPVTIPSPKVVPKADPNVNRATRTLRSTDKGERGEYAVERIVAKRFNPKKKIWEYQIKWEHFPSEDNTWEPMENLNHCKQMVTDFETQLTKLKAEKAQQQAANLVKNRPKILNTHAALASASSSVIDTPNRPQRTSKQKALDQVKAWCGSISDEENAAPSGGKRARSPDSDDSFGKRMKFEDSDDTDTDAGGPSSPGPPALQQQHAQAPKQYKKIAPKPSVQIIKNGLGQVGALPPNVLIPDANGVVRINQKQLPSLSAGVYIMSKTAGIIKLDSDTSKVATSGGQTIVKVAPKIGQTQIKIVKKDGSTAKQIVQMSPQSVNKPAPVSPATGRPKKLQTPIDVRSAIKKAGDTLKRSAEFLRKSQEVRKPMYAVKSGERIVEVAGKATPRGARMKEEARKPAQLIHESPSKRTDEESDDGLEELPFPEEIKIPEPDPTEDDFFLDPSTGKIAGQEYPDPEPEPEPMEEAKSDTSLDNIVKLAAADITEEDLKNEPTEAEVMPPPTREEEEEMVVQEKVKIPIRAEPIRKIVSASPTRTIVRMPMAQKKTTSSSILNKALTGQQVVRRSVLSTTPRMVHQRILNPTIARSSSSGTQVMSPIIRPAGAYVRGKAVGSSRPRGGASPRVVRAQPTVSPRSIYTYAKSPIKSPAQPTMRKIGNTIIRTASSPIVQMHQHQQLQQHLLQPQSSRPQPRGSQPRLVQSSAGLGQQRQFVQKKEPMVIRGQPEMIETRKVVTTVASKPRKVISMPSLMGDDELLIVPKPSGLSARSQSPVPPSATVAELLETAVAAAAAEEEDEEEEEQQEEEQPQHTVVAVAHAQTGKAEQDEADEHQEEQEAVQQQQVDVNVSQQQQHVSQDDQAASLAPDMSTFTLADNENPIFITGDDGTVYQVAGQNEQGQTILLTQGSDGQQQCLLVTNEVAEAMETAPVEEPQQPVDIAMPDISPDVTEPLSVKTDVADGGDQVVAQVVRAEPPSPAQYCHCQKSKPCQNENNDNNWTKQNGLAKTQPIPGQNLGQNQSS